MKFLILLLLIASSIFAQEREQGLVTNAPYWRQALGGNVLSLPSVQAQSAVVALDGGSIKAYSAAGNPMWTYSARGRISPFVSRSREGTSYFSRQNGILIAVNRAGRELWRRNTGSPLAARVIPGWDGRLFVPIDKKLICYTASGNLLWTKSFEHSFLIPPKINRNGGVIFVLKNNEVYQINPFGKTESWLLNSPPLEILSIGDDQQRILIVNVDGSLEILGMAQDWFMAAEESGYADILPRFPGTPAAAANRGNFVVSVLNDGRVSLISIDEREVVWTGESHIWEAVKNGSRPETEAEILYDQRGIYILSRNGATCFTHDGKRLWFTFLQNTAAIPAFGDDGVLYSGGRDWILYAYKMEDRVLPVKGNIYGPSPDGSYGTGAPHAAYMPRIPVFNYEIQSMLDNILESILAGNVGENELSWTSFLLTLAAGAHPGSAAIQHRVSAIKILGRIGSRETVPWLVNIFQKEQEPFVKAAAAEAIGQIGVDPEGLAVRIFLYTLIPDNIKDEHILSAIARSTGNICRFSGPPLSETGVRILHLLSANSQPPGIRRLAERELATLR